MLNYFKKMRGGGKSQKMIPLSEIFWSFFGAFVGMSFLCLTLNYFKFAPLDNIFHSVSRTDMNFVIASFGASSVLIFGVIDSPLAQPRNLVGGHVLSAIVGVACYQLFSPHLWLAASIAVSASISIMQLTKTLHPPGSATALIAVVGSQQLHDLGYIYVLIPILRGALILLIVALFVNNMSKNRRYPTFWW